MVGLLGSLGISSPGVPAPAHLSEVSAWPQAAPGAPVLAPSCLVRAVVCPSGALVCPWVTLGCLELHQYAQGLYWVAL